MLDIRRRTGYLFLAVMVGHVMLISTQVHAPSGASVIEAVTFSIFSEAERAAAAVIDGVRGVWSGYFALQAARAENEELRRQLADLQVRLQEQRALALRSQQLQALLDLRAQVSLPTAAATVISADPTPWFRSVTINKGTEDGLRPNMAVIAPDGLVGRIVGEVAPRAARVQLLIDRNAAAGAMIERSRASGVVAAAAGDPPLIMEYVSNQADVKVGDTVVSSGIDGIYPRGFVIGRVESAVNSPGGARSIRVRPAVDFTALDEVLVVLLQAAEPIAEGPE